MRPLHIVRFEKSQLFCEIPVDKVTIIVPILQSLKKLNCLFKMPKLVLVIEVKSAGNYPLFSHW